MEPYEIPLLVNRCFLCIEEIEKLRQELGCVDYQASLLQEEKTQLLLAKKQPFASIEHTLNQLLKEQDHVI
jgi:hypothetical protein